MAMRTSRVAPMKQRGTCGRRRVVGSSVAVEAAETIQKQKRQQDEAVVVGGGPVGLLTAMMLVQRGWERVQVIDRLAPPPPPELADAWGTADRSYNLGISWRGQRALKRYGALDRVIRWSAPYNGRKDWNPKGKCTEREVMERAIPTQVIQRDRLVGCILQEVEERFQDTIDVQHGVECVAIRWLEDKQVELDVKKEGGEIETIHTAFVIGADGANSVIHKAMEERAEKDKSLFKPQSFKVTRFPPAFTRVYKTVLLHFPDGWRKDFNYSARGEDDVVLEVLPTHEGLGIGVVLFKPENDRLLNLTKETVREFFDRNFTGLSPLIEQEELERFLTKRVYNLPEFQYSGPTLHVEGSTVLLGDAIHVVKPYFGLGLNSALEDVEILDNCLEEQGNDPSKAIVAFSNARAKDSQNLVEVSRKFDGGFVRFVLPRIIDGAFHKLMPAVFTRDAIKCMQLGGMTYTQVRWRKRGEKILQLLLVFGVLRTVSFVIGSAASFAMQLVA